jgi:hypothetical protein
VETYPEEPRRHRLLLFLLVLMRGGSLHFFRIYGIGVR